MQRVSNYIYANNELSNKLKRAEPVSIKVNCKRALFKDESLRFHKRLNTGLWSSFPDYSETPAFKKYYEDKKTNNPEFFEKMYGADENPEAEGAYQLLCKQWKF